MLIIRVTRKTSTSARVAKSTPSPQVRRTLTSLWHNSRTLATDLKKREGGEVYTFPAGTLCRQSLNCKTDQ